MYIFKYAYLSVIRNKGRNILIGLIITAITISACIALTITKSGSNLVDTYIDSNKIEVSFNMDPSVYRNGTTEDKTSYSPITLKDISSYAESSYLSDYYYILSLSMESDAIELVSYDDMFQMPDDKTTTNDTKRPSMKFNSGFTFIAYSNQAYNTNFIDGTNKITDGEMFDADNEDNVIVISSELAETNDIKINDKIKFYSSTDTTKIYEFTVIGIYEDTSAVDSDMMMRGNNSRNTIYVPINSMNTLLENEDDSTIAKGLSAKFYLTSNDYLTDFENEVRSKGLSSVYTVKTNVDEITETLKPIQNISKFSKSFLIVVLVIGALVLSVINILNIRERKYEIGVSRAIGMTKFKITSQLVAEMFIVSLASLIVGTIIGTSLSQPITNSILKNEIESYQTKETNVMNNFGGKEFSKGNMPNMQNMPNRGNSSNKQVDYVESLKVTISIGTIIQLFLISLTLTIVSGMIAIIFINQYEPNKILQNRS